MASFRGLPLYGSWNRQACQLSDGKKIMSWTLVVFTTAMHCSSAFSDAGYNAESLCQKAGGDFVFALEAKEQAKQKERTTVFKNGDSIVAYNARKWEFACLPTQKK